MKSRALVQRGSTFALEEVQLPPLKEHEVYVKVDRAAFNPTDRLALDVNAFGDGAVLGCDFAGSVVDAHPTAAHFSIGTRIAGLIWGGEFPGLGAYSEYTIANEQLSFPIPDNVTSAEASTVSLAANTAWLALFSANCLGLSRDGIRAGKRAVLIWGGSSTVGHFAIQLARHHGYSVVTTCSPRNFEHVRSLGAADVFEYSDPDVVRRIRDKYPDINTVFDTIGSPTSSATAAQVVVGHGSLCTVRPGKANTEDVPANVKVSDVFVFTAFPSEHSYRGKAFWPVKMEDVRLSAELYKQLSSLLQQRALISPRVRDMGRLTAANLEMAMADNREGRVSNEKLVFNGPPCG